MRRGRLNSLSDTRQFTAVLLAASHAVIEIQDVRLDLVSRIVPREMGHLEHVNDAAGISVAPFDQLMQHMIEV